MIIMDNLVINWLNLIWFCLPVLIALFGLGFVFFFIVWLWEKADAYAGINPRRRNRF
jgi:uncharacterized membrane protein